MRVTYDPRADAAMVYLIDDAPVDHWDVDEDGLVVGVTRDGRVAQCELWSIRSVGFDDYGRLPPEAKDELRRLTQTDEMPPLPADDQG